jgi:hypothetical protein
MAVGRDLPNPQDTRPTFIPSPELMQFSQALYAASFSPEAREVDAELSRLEGFDRKKLDQVLSKFFALMVTFNKDSLAALSTAMTTDDLIEPYYSFFLLNLDAAFQAGYRRATEEAGENELDLELLNLGAFALDAKLFERLCILMDLQMGSEEYVHHLLTHSVPLLFTIPPVFMAAYNNNVDLLRFMDTTTQGRMRHATFEGLAIEHFAAVGGAKDVLKYCRDELQKPLNIRFGGKHSLFTLSALGNDFETTKLIISSGFAPNQSDIDGFNDLFDENEVTSFYRFSPGAVYMKNELHMLLFGTPYVEKPAPVRVPAPARIEIPEVPRQSPESMATCDRIRATAKEPLSQLENFYRRASNVHTPLETQQSIFDEAQVIGEMAEVSFFEFLEAAEKDEYVRDTLVHARAEIEFKLQSIQAFTRVAIAPAPSQPQPQSQPQRNPSLNSGSGSSPSLRVPSQTVVPKKEKVLPKEETESERVCRRIETILTDIAVELQKLRYRAAGLPHNASEDKQSIFEKTEAVSTKGIESFSEFYAFLDDPHVASALQRATTRIEDEVERVKFYTRSASRPTPSMSSLPLGQGRFDYAHEPTRDLHRSTDPSPPRSMAPRPASLAGAPTPSSAPLSTSAATFSYARRDRVDDEWRTRSLPVSSAPSFDPTDYDEFEEISVEPNSSPAYSPRLMASPPLPEREKPERREKKEKDEDQAQVLTPIYRPAGGGPSAQS